MDIFENYADVCKRHRMDIMDEYLASIGQKRKPIPKDGSSLFRAVSEQLFSTQQQHIAVREACIAHMKKNRADFEDFVDDPFDEYLDRMCNPKESGDQIEISALSQLYRHDFYIFEQPGQPAKNVTENLFDKVVHLCHSGQKHYDCVYPVQYFSIYGICQSIVNSILLTKVLDKKEEEENKIVKTFRMLCCSDSDYQKDKKTKNQLSDFSASMVYEPSIGTFDKTVSPDKQPGLAFKLPVSLDFARSLDPFVCRNIDYDFWIAIKRRQQYIDFSIAEGLHYCIGDRCLVCLNIYSKPLVGHVQEISPDYGPITVFIEELGEMHTIAIKNAKPIESYPSGRNDRFLGRQRRHFNDDNWNPRSRRRQKSPAKNGAKSDRNAAVSYRGNNDQVNSRCSQHADVGAHQHRRYGGSKKNQRSPVRRGKQSKNLSSTEFYHFSKSISKGHSKPQNIDQSACAGGSPPSCLLHQLSFAGENVTEESFLCTNDEKNEMSYSMPHYSSNLDWEEVSSGFSLSCDADYPQTMRLPTQADRSDGACADARFWNDEADGCSSYSCEQLSKDENGESGNRSAEVPVASSTFDPGYTQESNPDVLPPNVSAPLNGNPSGDSMAVLHQDLHGETPVPLVHYGPSDGYVSYFPAMGPPYPCGSNPGPPPPNVAGTAPYSGSITMLDCEGKEMMLVDEKNPFQYFYNLGLEYYRQLSMGNPRGPSFGYGPSVYPPNAYGSPPPILQPHPVGYLPSPPNPSLVAPIVQPPPCVALPHFHPVVSPPPSGIVQFPAAPPARMLVHIPPAMTSPSGTTSFPSITESSATDGAATYTTSPNHEESCEYAPDQSTVAPQTSSAPAPSPVCIGGPSFVQSNSSLNHFPPSGLQPFLEPTNVAPHHGPPLMPQQSGR